MDEEIKNFIKVWVSATISISYCYYFSSKIKTGVLRLLSVLPICALFLVFPLFLSSSNLNFITSLYLSWLANFKLILFAFDKGSLFPLPPNLPQFLCFTSFPIILKQNPKSQDHTSKWSFPIKVLFFSVIIHMYDDYTQYLSPLMLSAFYTLHFYLALEVTFTISAFLVNLSLGCDLEKPFNAPILATSLQDFWGRRWNLITSDILRLSVFNPVRKLLERFMNANLAYNIGILATFFVSGVIHDVVFLYVTREMPTGEVTCFFLLNGVCRVLETTVKKVMVRRGWVVKPVVSRVLTMGFLFVTGHYLFIPEFRRNGVMEGFANESLLLNDFVKRSVFVPFAK